METNRLSKYQSIWIEVLAEIERSEAKFGSQDVNPMHPGKDYRNSFLGLNLPETEDVKYHNDQVMKLKGNAKIDHLHIILEEFLEVIDEVNDRNEQKCRTELTQLACVVIKAIKALDYAVETSLNPL